MLELPIKYVCSEDCAGLCVTCGKNLNDGDCGCKEEEGDPRWGVLKGLMDEKDVK